MAALSMPRVRLDTVFIWTGGLRTGKNQIPNGCCWVCAHRTALWHHQEDCSGTFHAWLGTLMLQLLVWVRGGVHGIPLALATGSEQGLEGVCCHFLHWPGAFSGGQAMCSPRKFILYQAYGNCQDGLHPASVSMNLSTHLHNAEQLVTFVLMWIPGNLSDTKGVSFVFP